MKIHPDNENFEHLNAIYGHQTIKNIFSDKWYDHEKTKCDLCLKDIECYWWISDPHGLLHICSECVNKENGDKK